MQSIDTPPHPSRPRWGQRTKPRRIGKNRIDPARLRFIGLITMLAIAVATLGASLVHEADRPPTAWVPVAKVAIPPGEALLPQDLELRKTVVPSWLGQHVTENPESLIGTIATVAIDPNEIIESTMVSHSAPTPPLPLVTVALTNTSIDPALIQAGDRVDVIATFTAPGGTATTEVLAPDVRVKSLVTTDQTYLVTVSVTHLETALAIDQAEQVGKVAIVGATGVRGHDGLETYPPIGVPHVG